MSRVSCGHWIVSMCHMRNDVHFQKKKTKHQNAHWKWYGNVVFSTLTSLLAAVNQQSDNQTIRQSYDCIVAYLEDNRIRSITHLLCKTKRLKWNRKKNGKEFWWAIQIEWKRKQNETIHKKSIQIQIERKLKWTEKKRREERSEERGEETKCRKREEAILRGSWKMCFYNRFMGFSSNS